MLREYLILIGVKTDVSADILVALLGAVMIRIREGVTLFYSKSGWPDSSCII